MSAFNDIRVSVFNGFTRKFPIKSVSLYDALFNLADRALVDEVRSIEDHDLRTVKKADMLTFTPSGVFNNLLTGAKPTCYSGVMCVDIDEKGNESTDWSTLRKRLSCITNVAYCGLSVSGRGLFLIIPISNPEDYAGHYRAFSDIIKEKFGLTTDTSCKNIGRLRVASYDDNAYFNPEATVFTLRRNEYVERPKYKSSYTVHPGFSSSEDSTAKIDAYIHYLCTHGIDITDNYNDWFRVGCALANELREGGRERFHMVSSINSKYRQRECDRKFNDCLKCNYITIGTFFHLCHQAGVNLESDTTMV